MKFLVFIWVTVELLQIAVIGMLVVGYRNLERRLRASHRFEDGPPPSVTEE
jgi:hypothetical protein